MRDLLNGVPKRRAVFDFSSIVIFSVFNCLWTQLLTSVVSKQFNSDLVGFIAGLFVFIVAWELLEICGDAHDEITSCFLEDGVSRYYLKKLYNIKPEVLKQQNTGYISGVLQKLMTQQVNSYRQIIMIVPADLVFMLYFMVVLGWNNVLYGAILVVCYVLSTSLRWLNNKMFVMDRAADVIDTVGERNKRVIDFMSNMGTVQKMGVLDYADNKLHEAGNSVLRACKRWVIRDEIGFTLAKGIMYSYFPVCVLIMYYTGDVVSFHNTTFMALLAAVGTKAVHNSKSFFRAIRDYGKFISAVRKLDFVRDDSNYREDIHKDNFEYAEIRGLDYSYDEDVEGISKRVRIQIPEFTVKRGDFVCITGESGQGKTTLLDVLSSQIVTNNVYINGERDNRRLDCVFVSQDTEIFDMSLRDNLTLGRDISDIRLMQLLFGVGMEEWICSQKNGLDTILGERGVFVSTGQRQRLNLIRGLLVKDKGIYLLDEPTSNVDEETEKRMIKLIRNELKGKTVVIVSHRPKIMEICNKHYEFVGGVLHRV